MLIKTHLGLCQVGEKELGPGAWAMGRREGGGGLFISHFWHGLPKFFQPRKCSHPCLRQHLITVVLVEDSFSLLQTCINPTPAAQCGGQRSPFEDCRPPWGIESRLCSALVWFRSLSLFSHRLCPHLAVCLLDRIPHAQDGEGSGSTGSLLFS